MKRLESSGEIGAPSSSKESLWTLDKRFNVPDFYRSVATARRQSLSVRRQGNGEDVLSLVAVFSLPPLMRLNSVQLPSCCYVPDTERTIFTPGRDRIAVLKEGNRVNEPVMPLKHLNRFTGGGVPDPSRVIATGRSEQLTVRGKRQGVDIT